MSTTLQLVEDTDFQTDVMRGKRLSKSVLEGIDISWTRRLFGAVATHDTHGWEPLRALWQGLVLPSEASTLAGLDGWGDVLALPPGMGSGSTEARRWLLRVVRAGTDAPYSELPQGEVLTGILRGEWAKAQQGEGGMGRDWAAHPPPPPPSSWSGRSINRGLSGQPPCRRAAPRVPSPAPGGGGLLWGRGGEAGLRACNANRHDPIACQPCIATGWLGE